MRNLEADGFYLRVYNPDGPVAEDLDFQIAIDAPSQGYSHPETDRDRIGGGEGEDILVGNEGIDGLRGESGRDRFVAEPFEVRDLEFGEKIEPVAESERSDILLRQTDALIGINDENLRIALARAWATRLPSATTAPTSIPPTSSTCPTAANGPTSRCPTMPSPPGRNASGQAAWPNCPSWTRAIMAISDLTRPEVCHQPDHAEPDRQRLLRQPVRRTHSVGRVDPRHVRQRRHGGLPLRNGRTAEPGDRLQRRAVPA